MKYSIFGFLFLTQICFGQTNFSFNQGEACQQNYFTTIQYESVIGKIIVNVSIHGKHYRLILDTGAPNIISKNLYNELKLPTLTKVLVGDQSGKADSMLVVLMDSMDIGGITFKNIPTLVSDDPIITECFHVDGFIGGNMIRNSIIRISSLNKTITLTDNKDKIALKKRQSIDLLFMEGQYDPYFLIKIKDKKNARVHLYFDSGDNGFLTLSLNHFTFLDKNEIFNHFTKGFGSNSVGAHGIANDTIQYRHSVPSLRLNKMKFKNVTFETTSAPNSRIGAKLLDYGIVTIDYINKKLYFEPFKKEADITSKHFPFDPSFINDKFVIGMVWGDKYRNTINVGDQIIEIDNINYENYTQCDAIMQKNKWEDKDKITLKLKDNKGLIKNVEIEKE